MHDVPPRAVIPFKMSIKWDVFADIQEIFLDIMMLAQYKWQLF
jgi:hypothetical protein